MTSYITITDAETDPSAPLTSELAKKWRDNPIAIAEGSAGAPRVQFAAMDAWFSTAGAIGTYVFAIATADTAFGVTVAGSTLSPTSAVYSNSGTSGAMNSGFNTGFLALSGTWRCMGTFDLAVGAAGGGTWKGATLWLRIA